MFHSVMPSHAHVHEAPSVLNTFRTMVTDDDILEKEDMYILGRIKEFVSNEEVVTFAAAKQLLILIERAVSSDDVQALGFILTRT